MVDIRHEAFTEELPEELRPGTADAGEAEAPSTSGRLGLPPALREILETALLTLVVFLALNTLTGRFQVRGSSMEPTLHNGQYLVISKLAYWLNPPDRGDVVVFHPPTGASDDYIKRIVGLPGEQVTVADGEIRIDGVVLEEAYVIRPSYRSGTWTLGPDDYFVLGDNRTNSSDSLTWGTLPGENIIGKAWLCYWPPTAWGFVDHQEFLTPSRPG